MCKATMTSSSSVSKHKDKKNKKKRTKKEKKSKKTSHTKDTDIGLNYDSGSESTDLAGELHSIGYYINDREEMINQMFSIIKPDKIRAMLPPILKDSSMQELKAYCLEELLGMSAKRIISVLEGRELETSSESDDGSPYSENDNDMSISPVEIKSYWSSDETRVVQESDVEKVNVDNIQEVNGLTNDMDTLEIGITHEEMGELLNCVPPGKKRHLASPEPCSSTKESKLKQRKLKDPQGPKKIMKKNIGPENSGNILPEEMSEERRNFEVDTNPEESKGKTLLEILELEMRARAIRALLKQGAGDGEDGEMSTEEQRDATEDSDANVLTDIENCTKSISTEDSSKKVLMDNDNDNVEPNRKKLKRKTSHNFTSRQCVNTVDPQIATSFDTDCPLQQNKGSGSKDTKLSKRTSMQDNDCGIIKAEVLSNDEETVDEIECDTKEIKLSSVKGTEITAMQEPDREDGELSSDIEKSSLHSVLEIQSEIGTSDIIVVEDSEDEVPDFQKSNSSKKLEDKQVDFSDVDKEDETKKFSVEVDRVEKKILINNNQENGMSHEKDIANMKISEKKLMKPKCQLDSDDLQSSLVSELSKEEDAILTQDFAQTKENTCCPHDLMKRNETADVSWAARWLQSKGVQKVVSTSKMCAKIRKRMKSAQKVKKVCADSLLPVPDALRKSSLVIVGSVNEYNMLDKPKVSEKECTDKVEKFSPDT